MLMVMKGDDLSYKPNRGFIETAAEGNRPVFMHPACGALAEVFLHVLGGFTDEMDVFKIADEGLFPDRGMLFPVITALHPHMKLRVEFIESEAVGKGGEEAGSDGFKPALDFTAFMFSYT